MSASLSGVFNLQEFTDLGELAAGFRLYTYAPATTTQKVAFTDSAGTIPHTYTSDGVGGQYLALNSRGELPAPLFLSPGGYDLTLKTAAGVTVWTRRAIGGDDVGSAEVADLRAELASTATGEGAALIGRAGQVVDSIAALRGLVKTAPSSKAFVTGYYAAGDGGGGAYYLDAADTTSTDNGGTVIVAADGGRWKLSAQNAVSVKQFGAKGDWNGTTGTDDTAALTAAIAAKWANLYFPDGAFRISSALNVASAGTCFYGAGRQSTKIVQTTNNAKILNVTGSYFTLSKMSFEYSTQGTTGATAIQIDGVFYSEIDGIYIRKANIGLAYTNSANSHKLSNWTVEDATTNGVLVDGSVNLMADKFQVLNSNTTLCALGCIRLYGAVEGCNFFNGHTFQGAFSLTTAATSFTFGIRPAYNKFHAVYFDASASGAVVDKTTELDFIDCWFSSRPGNGATIAQADGVRFNGGGAINCALHGVLVEASARRVAFSNFAARSNSALTPNSYSGILFAANATDFLVQTCTFTNDNLSFGTQKYGVEVQPGTSNRYVIFGNSVAGNGTGGFVDGGTGINKFVANNY